MKKLLAITLFLTGCALPVRQSEQQKEDAIQVKSCAKACRNSNMKEYQDDNVKCSCGAKEKE